MANELAQIAALLLDNRAGRGDWGLGSECSKGVANTFLICCLLDYQWDADVAWKKGEHLVKEAAPVPQGLQSFVGHSQQHLRPVRRRCTEHLVGKDRV